MSTRLYLVTCPHCRGLQVPYCGLCEGEGVVHEHPEHPLESAVTFKS
jgi:hypothetical protein